MNIKIDDFLPLTNGTTTGDESLFDILQFGRPVLSKLANDVSTGAISTGARQQYNQGSENYIADFLGQDPLYQYLKKIQKHLDIVLQLLPQEMKHIDH